MRTRIVIAAAAALGTAATAGVVGVTSAEPSHVTARPHAPRAVDPGDFRHPRQNPYFPLHPGSVLRYRGTDEGRHFHERVVVTHRTRRIQGVRARVVRDVLRRADGSLAEKTHDWYAADRRGDVWYFGERTATYDRHGEVRSREGSWQAGVDGARAGLVMPADPHPTDAYRQELGRGDAEDQAWVVQRGFSVRVPYGRVHDVVRSLEWSRLEKDVVSEKLYAPGLGIVSERDLAGGQETFRLVAASRP